MYIYQTGFHTFEESSYYEFIHDEKFTKKAFENKVTEALAETAVCYARDELVEDIRSHKAGDTISNYNRISIDTLFYHRNFKKAMNQRGFKSLKYEVEMSLNGWSSVCGNAESNDDFSIDNKQKKIHEKIRQTMHDAGIMFGIDEEEKKELENENR